MKKLFLSGGTGFVGKNILEQMGKEITIDAPSHLNLPLEDKKSMDEYFLGKHYDAIIHTAVKPYHRMASQADDVYDINMQMYNNLKMQVKKGRAEKMVVTGTGSEYGMEAYKPLMQETYFGQHIPKDAGTLSRYKMAEDIEKGDLPIYNMRIFGLFGKYEKHDMRFISSNILRLLFDLPMTMHQDKRFSYLYIEDFVDLLAQFVENTPKYKTYNIVPDDTVLLGEILQIIKETAEKPNHPIEVIKKGLGTEYTGDNSRLKSEFNGIRFTPIKEAIRQLYLYYKKNIDKFDKEDLTKDSLTR